MLAEANAVAIKIAEFIQDFWGGLVVLITGLFGRFILKRVIKSYTDDVIELINTVETLGVEVKDIKMNYLPRADADKVVSEVRSEHEKMFSEQADHHIQQREDFKHLVDRIDDLYELLTKK